MSPPLLRLIRPTLCGENTIQRFPLELHFISLRIPSSLFVVRFLISKTPIPRVLLTLTGPLPETSPAEELSTSPLAMVALWQVGPRPHIQFRNLGRSRVKGFSPSVRAPRNPMVIVLFMACLALWSHHIGLFASWSAFASNSVRPFTSASASNLFSYGTVRVDGVLQYEGERRSFPRDAGKEEEVNAKKNAEPVRAQEATDEAQGDGSKMSKTEVRPGEKFAVDLDISQALPTDVKQEDTVSFEKPENINHEEKESQQDTRQFETTPSEADEVRKVSLREALNFSKKTAINFMHFHKTGGVSFKTSLHLFYNDKHKGNGDPVIARDACYVREGVQDDKSQPSFKLWRCDWEPIQDMNEEERNKHDFVFGHQFWGNGVGELLNKRDLRTFTILRHPFDRKVSFYYHFFVREVGRKEGDVSFDEIRDFLLRDKLTIDAKLGRDLGPNYMAGRLLSNGIQGFVGNDSFSYFAVDADKKQEVADQAVSLLRDYLFVGLQEESSASQCMLRKVIELFNEINGVSNKGLEKIDEKVNLNKGSYSMSAKDIWSRFSPEDQALFDKKERVDVTIYAEGERLFRKQVQLFECADRLTASK